MNLTPKEIVKVLDEYVIGQADAKRTIAVALRNRYRRMQLPAAEQEEITPKNILMIGSTGVGKTEIARRLSRMFGLPFVKVEASKYTEVGYVGRDVESMVRDLAQAALAMVEREQREKNAAKISDFIESALLEKLVPALPKGASEERVAALEKSREKMREKLRSGALDEAEIELEVAVNALEGIEPLGEMQETLARVVGGLGEKKTKKRCKVKDARKVLDAQAREAVLDREAMRDEAHRRVENEGIIFIDEIDKVVVGKGASGRGSEPSKEGVQRDLLPIVEGSVVKTKLGAVRTDHILFIAAGAFHVSKPSDLIPELQGRFPLRVNLDSLDENALYEILTKPKNSLLKQYAAMIGTEGVELRFDDDAVRLIAALAAQANENVEDIGARRLHTVLEKLLDEISFAADEWRGREYVVDCALVNDKLEKTVGDKDLARYIL